jgi:hypothetical protein
MEMGRRDYVNRFALPVATETGRTELSLRSRWIWKFDSLEERMSFKMLLRRALPLSALLVALLGVTVRVQAQFPFPSQGPALTPKQMAPFDPSGYWVAVVTEDWQYRMMTPKKGDFPGIFLTPTGQALANSWDPAKDEANGDQCKSYGAGAIMRVPTRLHITWQDENTLKVETDAGIQTRLFHFGPAIPLQDASRTWQGYSSASWEGLRPFGFVMPITAGAARPPEEGYLKIITTSLRSGYLRKNGVPYSENATVEEYFDSFKEPNGDTWLIVTSIVSDPLYLAQSYLTSSQFKKLPDASGWNPTPCEAK